MLKKAGTAICRFLDWFESLLPGSEPDPHFLNEKRTSREPPKEAYSFCPIAADADIDGLHRILEEEFGKRDEQDPVSLAA